MLAAITFRIVNGPNAVHLWRGGFAEDELPKASMVKKMRLSTIHFLLVAKRICARGIEKLEEVLV
ncbi:MAG: hypothetical protein OXN97_02330 [Bryobacterales bacterium]|nr:hypothetical protein [Bryobacterales bacterium]